MALAPGSRLGVYEVIGLLGAGGMGEVYRAKDHRLHRHVALKVLPASVARDVDRLARFEREAQVLAGLKHPNIASIYGVEDSTGTPSLVMELVEGETLADRIARGPVPLPEALAIARQIADALESAHEHGIVHRDLKPANVSICDDGTVKLLDFGLAKETETIRGSMTAGPVPSESPTITSPAVMTGVGVMLGTAAYMCPEQARGKPADRRSDIWAFGCVLYECLTGRRAFPGEVVVETLAQVLTQDPDWGALPPGTPARLRTLLERTLRKDRRKRLADIADARLEIEDISTSASYGSAPPSAARPNSRVRWFATSAVLVLAGTLVGWLVGGRVTRNAAASAPPPSIGCRSLRLANIRST